MSENKFQTVINFVFESVNSNAQRLKLSRLIRILILYDQRKTQIDILHQLKT